MAESWRARAGLYPSLDKRTAGRLRSKRCIVPHDLIDCALKRERRGGGEKSDSAVGSAPEETVGGVLRIEPSGFTRKPGTSSAGGGSTWIHGDCASGRTLNMDMLLWIAPPARPDAPKAGATEIKMYRE